MLYKLTLKMIDLYNLISDENKIVIWGKSEHFKYKFL